MGLRRLPVKPLQSRLKSPGCWANSYHNANTSRAQYPLNPFYTWCNMLLTGLHNSSVVSITLLLHSNSSILSFTSPLSYPSLGARELGAKIIIIRSLKFGMNGTCMPQTIDDIRHYHTSFIFPMVNKLTPHNRRKKKSNNLEVRMF